MAGDYIGTTPFDNNSADFNPFAGNQMDPSGMESGFETRPVSKTYDEMSDDFIASIDKPLGPQKKKGKQLTFPAEVESDGEGHVMLFHFLKDETKPATPAFGVFRPPSMPKATGQQSKNAAFTGALDGGQSAVNKGAFFSNMKMAMSDSPALDAIDIEEQGFGATKRQKKMRTDLTVALYMPGGIKTSYGQNYQNQAGGFLNNLVAQNSSQAGQLVGGGAQAFIDIFKPGGLNVKEGFQGIRNIVAAVGAANFKGTGDMLTAGAAASVANTVPSITAAVAKIVNPRMEFLFQSTDPRTFSYQFKMNARSKEDSDSIAEIVQAFKVWSHPNVVAGTNGNVLHYPGQFEIQFMSYGRENKYLNKIADCVLTGMSVDYTTEGQFQAFRPTGKGSAPVTVTMDLTFREATVLTADMIAKGGY